MNIRDLEFRMYGFVPMQLTGIQKGIQFQHAVTEYMTRFPMSEDVLDELGKWAHYDKTSIVLNGGSTNLDLKSRFYGGMNKILDELEANFPELNIAKFYEPDLGNQLTAFCFLVDERVWNTEKYPDFRDWVIKEYSLQYWETNLQDMKKIGTTDIKTWFSDLYTDWQNIIGNDKNLFLRDYLKQFKLA